MKMSLINIFQNNRLMKLGNTCYISNLPADVYPADIAIGIQEIKAGNNVTTEDDEVLQYAIILEDGPLTTAEESALHADIKSRCSPSNLKFKTPITPITESQSEDLKNGNTIVLDSGGDCKRKVIFFKYSVVILISTLRQ